MEQSVLLLDTPQELIMRAQELERIKHAEDELKKMIPWLETQLAEAKQQHHAARGQLRQAEKQYFLACCYALEQLMKVEGKGWCPACQQVVEFEGFSFGYHIDFKHHEEQWSSNEYHHSKHEAYDQRNKVYYRLPHQCRVAEHVVPTLAKPRRWAYGRDLHGGTIADAPITIFLAYGIPQTEGLQGKMGLTVWDFAEPPA